MPKHIPYEDQLKPLSLRVAPASRNWIDQQAKSLGTTRTILVRAMLSVATKHFAEVTTKVRQLQQAEASAGVPVP